MSLKRSSLLLSILLSSVQFLIGLTASANSGSPNSIAIKFDRLLLSSRLVSNTEGKIARSTLNEFEVVEQAIRTNALDAETYQRRGIIRSYSEQDYQGAIEDYSKSLNLDPDNAETYNYRGTAYFRLGNYQKALLDFDRAIGLKPDLAVAYYNRGYVRQELGDKKGAIEDFRQGATLSQQQGDTDTYQQALEIIRKLEN